MTRKRFDEDFKKQLVKIYNQGNHSYRSLSEEYGVSAPIIRTWVIRYNESSSFNIDDNRTEEERDLIELRKRVKQLEWRMIFALKDKFHYGNELPSESLKSKLHYY